ncbi:MAG: hypothetical protein K2I23_05060, partial [Clostridia bacterium]|nr:hypothetical protein [Clostridia bacterium]
MHKTKETKRIKIIVASILALAMLLSCLIMLFNDNNDNKVDIQSAIQPLASTSTSNQPVTKLGTIRNTYGEESNYRYSQLTGNGSRFTYDDNKGGLVWFKTPEETAGKHVYFDILAEITVPRRTEYKVKYTVTFDAIKYNTSGVSNTGVTLRSYDFGTDTVGNGLPRNAQNLYSTGEDLQFNIYTNLDTDNKYWTGGIKNTIKVEDPLHFTYEVEDVLTNEGRNSQTIVHSFGYYATTQQASAASFWLEGGASISVEIVEEKSVFFSNPVNVDTAYTGSQLTLANITDKTKTSWFNASEMRIDYPSGGMTDVGDYTVKAVITSNDSDYIFAGNPDTSKGETSNKERVFTFKITPKQIKVTVNKDSNEYPTVSLTNAGDVYTGDTAANKRAPSLGFRYTSDNGYDSTTFPTAVGTYTATPVILNADTCKNYAIDSATATSTTFTINKTDVTEPKIDGEAQKGYTGGEITFKLTGGNNTAIEFTLPDGMTRNGNTLTAINAGKYRVTATLADHGDSTQWSKDGSAGPIYLDYEITKKDVKIPKIASGAERVPYNGNKQPFTLQNLDANWVEIRNNKNEVVTALEEKNAGTYTYTLSLKDSSNTKWEGTSDDVSSKDVIFYIDKLTLDITSFTCSVAEENGKLSWEKGTAGVTFTVVVNSLTGDTVKLQLYRERNGEQMSDFVSVDESVAKTVTVTMPSYLDQGSYILGVKLADPASDNANSNYVLTTATSKIRKSFTVKGLGLTLTETNMPWVYKYTDKDNTENVINVMPQVGVTQRKAQLTYTGYEYEFTVDLEELETLGAQIDKSKGKDGFSGDTKWTNATTAEKTVTVYWKPLDGYDGTPGSFTLKYEIAKAKYDLSGTKWSYMSPFEFDSLIYRKVELIDLPKGLSLTENDYSGDYRKRDAGTYRVTIKNIKNDNPSNYETPSFIEGGRNTYIYNDGEDFPWILEWKIEPKKLNLRWTPKMSDNSDFEYFVVVGDELQYLKDKYTFYEEANYDNVNGVAVGSPIAFEDIVVHKKQKDSYWVVAELKDDKNYMIASNKAQPFTVGTEKELVKVELKDKGPFEYNGEKYGEELIVTSDDGMLTSAHIVKKYYKDSIDAANELKEAPTNAGDYIIVLAFESSVPEEDYEFITNEIRFTITPVKITATWNTEGAVPKLAGDSDYLDIIEYIYTDADGNVVGADTQWKAGNTYYVKAVLKDKDNYVFVSQDGEKLEDPIMTGAVDFTIEDTAPTPTQPEPTPATNFDVVGFVKENWQVIVSIISIILIFIFTGKGIGYASKRKSIEKTIDKKYGKSTYYAASGIGLFGLPNTTLTIIACILAGVAVLAFIFMLLEKRLLGKAQVELEDAKEEYAANKAELDNKQRNDQMQMMLMGMLGNNGGQFSQQGASIDDMRMMINDAVTAMLPNVQQYLPQQASGNDELVKKLMEQNAQNEERIEKLMKKLADQQPTEKVVEKVIAREVASANANDETIKSIIEGQKIIMQKLAEQQSTEKVVGTVVAREVAVANNANDETIKQLMMKQEDLMRNQER